MNFSETKLITYRWNCLRRQNSIFAPENFHFVFVCRRAADDDSSDFICHFVFGYCFFVQSEMVVVANDFISHAVPPWLVMLRECARWLLLSGEWALNLWHFKATATISPSLCERDSLCVAINARYAKNCAFFNESERTNERATEKMEKCEQTTKRNLISWCENSLRSIVLVRWRRFYSLLSDAIFSFTFFQSRIFLLLVFLFASRESKETENAREKKEFVEWKTYRSLKWH